MKEHQLDTNQLRHQVGTNQMAPLPGIEPGSNGVVATAAARDESEPARNIFPFLFIPKYLKIKIKIKS